MLCPPASKAPLLAASMIPGPPPVITAKGFPGQGQTRLGGAEIVLSRDLVRALPKIGTALAHLRQAFQTPDELDMMRKMAPTGSWIFRLLWIGHGWASHECRYVNSPKKSRRTAKNSKERKEII